MAASRPKRIEDVRKKDDLIVITGAGGFIGGSLVRYFRDKGFTRIRAVDKKPLEEWYRRTPGVEDLVLDVARGPSRSTTWPPTWAAWASSNATGSSACGAFSSIPT